MEILGYIVQCFHEDKFLPETGFKHLYKAHSEALNYAKGYVQDYLTSAQANMEAPFELHTPSKKQTDEAGYSVVFRNPELQVWIEAIVR